MTDAMPPALHHANKNGGTATPPPAVAVDEILEPVKNDAGELYWLTRHYEKHSIGNPNRPVKEIIKENKPLIEIPIFSLWSPGIWKCNKCGAVIQSNPGPPIECYENQGGCNRTSTSKVVTKIINPDFWKIPRWQDIPDTKGIYQELYDLIRKCLVFVEDIHYKIYTLDIISSYFIEEWETLGFPAFIGLMESGKSRALDIIAETGWRMINAGSGVSFPAMVRGTHLYGAGILIDEAHDKLTPKTETGQQMIDFLKPGYRRGSHYIVAEKEDPLGMISYNNFGFKAFAGERDFDRAMMSRCKIYEMEQDYPEITNLKEIRNELSFAQTKLINLKYKNTTPIPEIPKDIGINGRNLEIFHATIRTAMFLGVEYMDIVDYAKQRKEEEVESFRNTDEYEVLSAIKNGEENERLDDAPESISYTELISRMKWKEVEGQQNPGQRLGYIFSKKLHLKARRRNDCTVLLMNDPKNARKLKYLYRRYKV